MYWNKYKYRHSVWGQNQVNCYHYLLIQCVILLRLTDRGTSGLIKYKYSIW